MVGLAASSRSSLNSGRLIRGLVVTDGLFILTALLCGVAAWVGLLDRVPRRLGLEYDQSIANIWNYLKWAGVSVLFAHLWRVSHSPVHLAASVIFLAIFLDDAFELHEAANGLLAQMAGGMARHQMGAVVLIVLALGAGLLMALAWHQSDKATRAGMVPVIALTAALIVVGGSLDLVQSEVGAWVPPAVGRILGFGIGVLEDGAELVFGSLILAATVQVWQTALQGMQPARGRQS